MVNRKTRGRIRKTRKQRGGFLGFSNNDNLRFMLLTRPELNIKDICEQVLLELTALRVVNVYSLLPEDDTALKQFEFVLSQNRAIKRFISKNSVTDTKREEILNNFRQQIKDRIEGKFHPKYSKVRNILPPISQT